MVMTSSECDCISLTPSSRVEEINTDVRINERSEIRSVLRSEIDCLSCVIVETDVKRHAQQVQPIKPIIIVHAVRLNVYSTNVTIIIALAKINLGGQNNYLNMNKVYKNSQPQCSL